MGYLLDRWSIRGTMVLGAGLAAAGFQFTARADSLLEFLVGFGVIVGAGASAMGVIPAAKLATNWYPHATGKAIGFVSLPLIVTVAPPLFGLIILDVGWRDLLRGISYVYLLAVPVLLLIRDRPPSTTGAFNAPPIAAGSLAVAGAGWRVLADRRLWLMVLVSDTVSSGGIILTTHIVQHALGLNIPLPAASLLLSVSGVASAAGTLLFGWLSDRVSPLGAIGLNVATGALIWPLLINLIG